MNTINEMSLKNLLNAKAKDADFNKSVERIAKLAAQIVDLDNEYYRISKSGTMSPEKIIFRADDILKVLTDKCEKVKRSLFWLNRKAKMNVGSPILTVRVTENVIDVCADFLACILDDYRARA